VKPEDEKYKDGGWIVLPKIIGDKVVALKYRSIKAKVFTQAGGFEQPSALFNVETISPFDPIFVTEGEFDTAILEQAGFHAVSVPAAGVKLPPEMKKRLKSAECIYLAGDNDGKVGTLYMQQLARELGEATYIVKWDGAKDANEFFLKHRDDFVDRVNRAVQTARSTPVEEFMSLTERLLTAGDVDAASDPHRAHMPWKAVDDMNYTPAGGIIIVYSTYSGTGKTVFTTEWMLHEAKRGEVVVVFSPELRDAQYLALVASQTLGPKMPNGLPRGDRISAAQFAETAKLLDVTTDNGGNFQYYVGHRLPVSQTSDVIAFIEHVVQVTGATRFVIDTVHRVVGQSGRESQTEAEGRVVKEIERIAIKYACTFILIGQSNKEAEGLKEANRDELGVLRGCRELTDVAYGVYLLHRKRINQKDSDANDILESKCDVHLKKDRGRGPGKPMVSLVYGKPCSNFREYTSRDADEFPTMRKTQGDEDDVY
jgi:replicative DNA helicase